MSLWDADRAGGATLLGPWVELREEGGRTEVPMWQQEEGFLPVMLPTNSASISLFVLGA